MERKDANYLDAASGHLEVSTVLMTAEIQDQQLKQWAKQAGVDGASFLFAVEEGSHVVAKLANNKERYEKAVTDARETLKRDPEAIVYVEPRLYQKIENLLDGEDARIQELQQKITSITMDMNERQNELIKQLEEMTEKEKKNLQDAKEANEEKTREMEELRKEMADMRKKMKQSEEQSRTKGESSTKDENTRENPNTKQQTTSDRENAEEEASTDREDNDSKKKSTTSKTSGN